MGDVPFVAAAVVFEEGDEPVVPVVLLDAGDVVLLEAGDVVLLAAFDCEGDDALPVADGSVDELPVFVPAEAGELPLAD